VNSSSVKSQRSERYNQVTLLKVAIYARISSDNQRDASTADQLRCVTTSQLARVGQLFTIHRSRGLGATPLRSGFQTLMRDALNGRFDVALRRPWTVSAGTRKTQQASSSVSPSPA
jgi:hypothetical protein